MCEPCSCIFRSFRHHAKLQGLRRSGHAAQSPSRYNIVGTRVDLDDLLLFKFVLHTEDKSCIVRVAIKIVDDCSLELRSERPQDVHYQIIVQRPFLQRAFHEHRDRRTNALIDQDHESLLLVAKKNGEAAVGRRLWHGCALRQRAYSYCEHHRQFTWFTNSLENGEIQDFPRSGAADL